MNPLQVNQFSEGPIAPPLIGGGGGRGSTMRALDILEKTIVKNSIQYAIGLPWEKEETKLPYNRDLAVNKFKSTKNKFNKNTETMTK